MRRKGLGKGRGKGYKNIMSRDPIVHSQSRKGIKQPQKINLLTGREHIQAIARGHGGLKYYDYFVRGIPRPLRSKEMVRESIDAKAMLSRKDKITGDVEVFNYKTLSFENPFEYQDKNQEKVIQSGWHKGNSYRFVLEGTGDIFRELSKPFVSQGYISNIQR